MDKLQADFPTLEHGVGRDDFLYTAQFLEEEFRHYVLFADVIDTLTGGQITPEELAKYEYAEETKLRLLRKSYVDEHGDLASFASSFCEGGGASIYYEGSLVGGNPLNNQIAAACKGVYDDEVDHAAHGAAGLAAEAKTDKEWEQATEMVTAISQQRVRMRNEQFGFPLTDDRLQEIANGKIDLPARYAELLV